MSELFKEWHWEITRRCNLLCRHCLTNCGQSPFRGLTTVDALKAIKVMAESGCIRLMITGGEPLMRKDFFPLLESGFSHGLLLGLLTNGFRVNQRVVRQLSAYIKTVGVSLDGISAKTHDALRGQQSFQRACQAIRLLSSSLPVAAYITVSALNVDEIRDIIGLAFKLGASRIHVSEISIDGRAKDNKNLLTLQPNQKKLLEQLAGEMTGSERIVDCHCNVDLFSLYLSAEGLVYPCSEVGIRNPSRNLGRITDEDFEMRLLRTAQEWQAPTGSPCCYHVFAGENVTFCLNTGNNCCLSTRKGGSHDYDFG